MLLMLLLLIPLVGIFIISSISYTNKTKEYSLSTLNQIKTIGLFTSVINFFVSLIVFMLFNFSSNQFQSIQEYHRISSFDFYLGVDGISIYFVLLTTIIMPISLLSNWTSISENVKSYVIIILLLETLLLLIFLTLLATIILLTIIFSFYFLIYNNYFIMLKHYFNKFLCILLCCFINNSANPGSFFNLPLQSSAIAISLGSTMLYGVLLGSFHSYLEYNSLPHNYEEYNARLSNRRISIHELTTFSDNSYTYPTNNPFTDYSSHNPFTHYPSVDCFN